MKLARASRIDQECLKNRHKNLRRVVVEIVASEQESDADEDPISDLNDSVDTQAQSVRILNVEDSEIVAGIAKEMLENQGWQVETCADGNAALEKISTEAHYHLLLIDYDLPGVNGLELVRRARNLAHRARTPIVSFRLVL